MADSGWNRHNTSTFIKNVVVWTFLLYIEDLGFPTKEFFTSETPRHENKQPRVFVETLKVKSLRNSWTLCRKDYRR